MKANKPHHQKNISVMEDLVNWAVGVKDCRTKPRLENGVNSPILHPLHISFSHSECSDLRILFEIVPHLLGR